MIVHLAKDKVKVRCPLNEAFFLAYVTAILFCLQVDCLLHKRSLINER